MNKIAPNIAIPTIRHGAAASTPTSKENTLKPINNTIGTIRIINEILKHNLMNPQNKFIIIITPSPLIFAIKNHFLIYYEKVILFFAHKNFSLFREIVCVCVYYM